MTRLDHSAVVDCVSTLAAEIARTAPDCADKAMRIADLVQDLRPSTDRDVVQDAIEANMSDSELTEPQLQCTVSAIVNAIKNGHA